MPLGPPEPGPHGPDDSRGLLPTALEHPGREPGILDLGCDLDGEEGGDGLQVPADVHEELTYPLVLGDEDVKVIPPMPIGQEDGGSGGQDVMLPLGNLPSPPG